MDERHARIKSLFQQASEMSATDCATFLAAECGSDSALIIEIESLLKHYHNDTTGVLETHVADLATSAASIAVPERLGGFRILEKIGEGGMGVVYRAEQDRPRRTVALKVIKPGIASSSALRRFEQEAELLGRLQHPGIAQVFEAGTADAGHGVQPFFAMELIEGRSLNEFVSRSESGTRDRLQLVARICDAVQHAHQKGVIHRDLKPGNILVTDVGTDSDSGIGGQPKVLDFGVARTTDSDMRATSFRTDLGQLVGTLAYMSPEQVAGEPDHLDTRSDVYALGVICYELLTGRLPQDIRNKSIPEAVRAIGEDDPTPLSSINSVFRGDLETIVSKALEKDPDQRYQSASDLGSDIRRYLSDEPISARRSSSWYQVRKFARRNRVLVGSAMLLTLVLVIAATVSTVLAAKAMRAEGQAREQAEVANTVNRFLNNDLLAAMDPKNTGTEVTVRSILDRAADELDHRFDGMPQVEASVRMTLGRTYARLGEYSLAEEHLERGAELYRAESGESDPETLQAVAALGDLRRKQGRYTAAAALLEPTAAGALALLPESDPVRLGIEEALSELRSAQGRYDEAEEACRRILAVREDKLGPRHPAARASRKQLGGILMLVGRYDEADPLYTTALAECRVAFGEDHLHTIEAMNNLAALRAAQGRFDEAESLRSRILDVSRRVLGERHPTTLSYLSNLGTLYADRGKLDAAEPVLRESFDLTSRALGESHPATLDAMNDLALLRTDQGFLEEGATLHEKCLARRKDSLGSSHPSTLGSMQSLASVYESQGRYADAELLLSEAVSELRSAYGVQHRSTLVAISNLGLLYRSLDEPDKAESLIREAYEAARANFGEQNPTTITSMANLALVLSGQRRFEEAKPLAIRALELRRSVLGPEHHLTLVSLGNLAALHYRQQEYEKAAQRFEEALAIHRKTLGDDHPNTVGLHSNLAMVYNRLGAADKALAMHEESLKRNLASHGEGHPATIRCRINIGTCHLVQGRSEVASQMFSTAAEAARRSMPEGHSLVGYTRLRHGEALLKIERYDQAESVLLEAQALLEDSEGPSHRRTQAAVQMLVDLYDTLDRDDEANQWRKRLAADPHHTR